jgi:hypothetical protein
MSGGLTCTTSKILTLDTLYMLVSNGILAKTHLQFALSEMGPAKTRL